jgi:hypothetical protein
LVDRHSVPISPPIDPGIPRFWLNSPRARFPSASTPWGALDAKRSFA